MPENPPIATPGRTLLSLCALALTGAASLAQAPASAPLPKPTEQVTVTAYRTPIGDLASPANTRLLTPQQLQESPSPTLDGKLRQVAGVETFRRSSSLVANPSSQGLSLRGLGSTSASRTLLTSDDIPLNDPFGGWIHWEETPVLALRSVELVRGGASDLYGSSAIGGVVNLLTQHPTRSALDFQSSYGGLATWQQSLLAQRTHGHWGALAAATGLGTDGFTQLAAAQRGSVDSPSNVHAQSALALLDHQSGALRLFLRTSLLNEDRNNGTPIQTNATRLWRYAAGADCTSTSGATLTFRAYGSTEHYRQTFSTIAASRNFESLNRFARTPAQELGAVLHLTQPIGPRFLLLAGADTHDVRAHDDEATVSKGAVTSRPNITDRQRQTGLYAQAIRLDKAWTLSASARIDWFQNFDALQFAPTIATLPKLSEHPFDPRLGIARRFGPHFALSANAFRAYRAPTPNELYRSTQVGSLLTLPNNALRSERATGWEAGAALEYPRATLRAGWFFTQVNRPITALTINPTSSPIKLQRENLGQLESSGLSLDAQFQPIPAITLTAGYQFANATVTRDAQQTALVGKWIPQVAHQMATLQLRGSQARFGTLSLQGKFSGRQFDDDANTYLLHGYFRLDAYATRALSRRLQLYASGENLLNRSIEVGRTPSLTLGTPAVATVGINLRLFTLPK